MKSILVALLAAVCPLGAEEPITNAQLILEVGAHVRALPEAAFFFASSSALAAGESFDAATESAGARDDYVAFFAKLIAGYEAGYLAKVPRAKLLADADDMVFFTKCMPDPQVAAARRKSLEHDADRILPSVAHGLTEAETVELTVSRTNYLGSLRSGVARVSQALRAAPLMVPERFLPGHVLEKWRDISPLSPRKVAYDLPFVTHQYVDDKLHAMYERSEFTLTLTTNAWYGTLALISARQRLVFASDAQIDAWVAERIGGMKDAEGRIPVGRPLRG